uniref:hypothetical protein n=1 Tax=Pararhizobium sp. IMCC3301 TaxID=3067904 RepID=UPI002740F02B|nr:hypothetical protein [Pararhizobium sp. IMCC3301]
MTNSNDTIYYSDGRGICVTGRRLRTRFKDEALAPVQSVQIGREPLMIAAVVGIGLTLFANRFGDLLLFHEQIILVLAGLTILAVGYSIAALRIGQYMHEKTVLWSTIWTVRSVREAIARAKHAQDELSSKGVVVNSEGLAD